MAQAEPDQTFVEYVVKAIVDHPDDVSTDRSVDERGVLIQLTVNPEDMGKVIGKDGRTAIAIRKLLHVLGAKHNARVNLKIVEPDGSEVRSPNDTTESGSAKGGKETMVDIDEM
jgi:predicted RNA-binding protein YlqC (UPF0109 family)